MEYILDYKKEMRCIDQLIGLHHMETAYRRGDYVLAHIQQSDSSSSWEQAFQQKLSEIRQLSDLSRHYLVGNWEAEHEARKFASELMDKIRSDLAEGNRSELMNDCIWMYRSLAMGDGVEYQDEFLDIINHKLDDYDRLFVLQNVFPINGIR